MSKDKTVVRPGCKSTKSPDGKHRAQAQYCIYCGKPIQQLRRMNIPKGQ